MSPWPWSFLWVSWLGAGAIRPPSEGSRPLEADSLQSCEGVLFFSSVSNYKQSVKQNVLHLHSSGLVDIFLAHPRQDLADWQKESWYQQTVKYSVSYNDIKAGFVFKELVKQQTFRLNDYCWYWLADEDLDFTHLNLRRYLSLAMQSGAFLVQPAAAFDTMGGIPLNDAVMAYAEPVHLPHHPGTHGHSLYRYSDLVQAMSPMFTPESLTLAWELYIPGLGSAAGMELLWCRFVAAELNRSVDQACAIIDAEPMYKLPNIRRVNPEDEMAVEEVLVDQHSEYLQRTVDDSGKLREGLQLCRTELDPELVHLRVRPRHYEALLLVKAFFRCKRFSLQAVCNIDLRVILAAALWLVLEVLLFISIPLLLWYILKYIWSKRNAKDEEFARKMRIPYRQQVLSNAN